LIKISFNKKQFIIETCDEAGRMVFKKPLHRIYFRSNLNGELDEFSETSKFRWTVYCEDKANSILEKIIAHFVRYNIIYELDNNCKDIIKREKKKRDEYLKILENGTLAKENSTETVRNNILEFLNPEFKRDLKQLQLDAVYHLLAIRNGANFSVPGSGKTTIALAYYHILRIKKEIKSLLVIGPASCFEPWENEYLECFGKKPKSVRIAGKAKEKRKELYLTAEKYEILLLTYHSAARDVEEIENVLRRRKYLLVLDESHYIKRPKGGKIADAILEIARYARYRIILTGTPMPNSLEDLWSQFTFLWNKQLPLGTVDSYLREVRENTSKSLFSSVKNRISPLFFRITKSQLGLPKPNFKIIKCKFSPLQLRIYRGVAARFLSKLKELPQDRDALREWRRARAIRLLQIAVNPALLRKKCDEFLLPPMDLKDFPLRHAIEYYGKYEMPIKFEYACKMAHKLTSKGNKVIIWSSFVHNLHMLANQLKQLEPVVVYGGVPYASTDREEISREYLISRFKTDPRCKLLIANPAACAESISLHKVCHHSIYLDRSFNCAHYLQSLDRIHRLGLSSKQRTFYYLILASDSIDEIVHTRLKAKMRNMRQVIEGDLPGNIPGYWGDDLGEEENIDLDMVEKHIKTISSTHDYKTR
jgi:SNF2 family DNA or RNA helicase